MADTHQHTPNLTDIKELINCLPVSDQVIHRPPYKPVREFQLWLKNGSGRIHKMTAAEIIEHIAAGDFDDEDTHHAIWRLRHLIEKAEHEALLREIAA